MAKELSLGSMFSTFGEIFGRNVQLILVVALVQALALGANEVLMPLGAKALVSFLVSFFVGYHVLEALLDNEGLLHDSHSGRRYLSYFGASLLAGLGMIVGLLFFILPGVLLIARWSVALSFVIGEGDRATEALRKSWEATRGSTWSILAIYLIFGLGLLVLFAAIGASRLSGDGISQSLSFGAAVLTNFGSGLFGMASSVLSVAIYRLVSGPRGDLRDIFA